MKTLSNLFFICLASFTIQAQTYTGVVMCKESQKPIGYVNIGIIGKGIGTVSDHNGSYSIQIGAEYNNDTLLFSCIGYHPISMLVHDFKKLSHHDIMLEERFFEIEQVVVSPNMFKPKMLGYNPRVRGIQAGFKDNLLGYECGVLINVEKSAYLETIRVNFSKTSFDTIFYRVNIYKATGNNNFENILQSPIYINLPKEQLSKTVVVDLKPYNILINGDFLVTLEHVKDLGEGFLYFVAGMRGKTYIRKTSQATWETKSVGISISVDARVEQ